MIQEKRENFMFTNDTIFIKTPGSYASDDAAESDAGTGCVADAFMLGGMDQNYMSAVSLATQIQFIQNMLLSAATGGLAILGAQYWGRGNIKTLDDIFCMALRLCGLVSIAFFIACICFPQYLMLFLRMNRYWSVMACSICGLPDVLICLQEFPNAIWWL